MIIFPAIDIKEGRVVRLLQGDFDQVTEYSGDPVIVAKKWQDKGAEWLHVVDLDGARTGESQNFEIVLKIVKGVKIPIQVGGGIRTREYAEKLLSNGISRIILGTRAIEDKNFLKDLLKNWREKIAISLDCSKGMVAQRGWTSTTNIKAIDFIKELEQLGVACIIYTDIARDGMLMGPNFEELDQLLSATKIPIIVSGGVSSLDDIKKSNRKGVVGVITGKALYEGKFTLQEALAAAC